MGVVPKTTFNGNGNVGRKIAAVAIVSIPAAVVLGVGYGAYALYRRVRPETPEEYCARMERVAHLEGFALERRR